MKRPDFIVQDDFGDVLKMVKYFFSGVKGLLRTIGVLISRLNV
jgi:hypothetical protein